MLKQTVGEYRPSSEVQKVGCIGHFYLQASCFYTLPSVILYEK